MCTQIDLKLSSNRIRKKSRKILVQPSGGFVDLERNLYDLEQFLELFFKKI